MNYLLLLLSTICFCFSADSVVPVEVLKNSPVRTVVAANEMPQTYNIKIRMMLKTEESKLAIVNIIEIDNSVLVNDEVTLKAYFSSIKKGSKVIYSPSCVEFGETPFSSNEAIESFSAWLKEKGVTFEIIPCG